MRFQQKVLREIMKHRKIKNQEKLKNLKYDMKKIKN